MIKIKYIIGYEKLYSVSNDGRIYSHITKKYLKQCADKDGYMTVCLIKNNKRKTSKVHRMVAEAFIENPESKPQVNHKKGDKSKNDYQSLEWSTAKENVQHAFDNGLNKVGKKSKRLASERCKKIFTGRKDTVGSMNGRAKLTEKDIPIIRQRISDGENMSKISRDYDVSANCIYEIKIGKRWSHVT